MYYPKRGRVVDLEEGNFNIKKKREIQKREKEDTNKLKYELLEMYSKSPVFERDGLENVKDYFSIRSSQKVASNVALIKVDVQKRILKKIEPSRDFKKKYMEFKTEINKMVYKFV